MSGTTYAALLREVASCLDDGPLAGVPRPADEQAAQLRALADLLDRVTPERIAAIMTCAAAARCPEVLPGLYAQCFLDAGHAGAHNPEGARHQQWLTAKHAANDLCALAAGPQGEDAAECKAVEMDGAYHCFAHRRTAHDVVNPDAPCAEWTGPQPEEGRDGD